MDIEQKKRRLQFVVALGLGALLIVLAPLLILLAKASIAGLAIAIAALAALNVLPVLGMKFANWRLRAIKAEAAANPIETMEQEYIAGCKVVEAMEHALQDYEAAVNLFVQKAKATVEKYPHRRTELESEVAGRIALLDLRSTEIEKASTDLKDFREKIDEERMVNETALAMLAVDNLTPSAEQRALSQIKLSAASEQVQKNAATSVAKLNASLRKLDYDPSKKLEVKELSMERARQLLG